MEIKQVIMQSEITTNSEGQIFNIFDIIFQLVDGTEAKGCSHINNIGGEGTKAFNIIRNALPQNIPFIGNLTTQDDL